MKSYKRIVWVLCSLMAAGLLVIAVKSMAAVVTNVHIPISGTVVNPCNGETVTFSGVDHFTATVTLDSSGGFHLTAHDNIHVTATGSLGNTYEGNHEDTFAVNGRVGFEQIQTLTLSAIALGNAPNFEEHALFHITVHPDGTVTGFVNNSMAVCRG